jgi:RNA polymerase sigma-70 factor (ECF subfamily)
LYESLAPGVSAYVRMQGFREGDDIANEVFLAAFTRLGSFRGDEGNFRSWVFTIAHHRIVDARRAHARAPQWQDIDVAPETALGPPARSLEDEVISSLELGRLRATLDRLTPDQRDVLELRVIADLSVEQVAHLLGKHPGAVRALQHRALAALRRLLATEAVTS